MLAAGTFAIGIPAIQMSSIQYILNLSDNQNIEAYLNHKLGSIFISHKLRLEIAFTLLILAKL